MQSKTIVVPGKPQGKGRPRFTRYGRPYTPDTTRQYEELIRACWMEQADGWEEREGGVGMIVTAYFPIPASANKDRKSGMQSGRILPEVKPDGDNILKIICDALNGYAYTDDKQVVSMSIQKRYSDDPRVEVVLYDC